MTGNRRKLANITWRCPDCTAVSTLRLRGDGRTRTVVYHDRTCPWLARRGEHDTLRVVIHPGGEEEP